MNKLDEIQMQGIEKRKEQLSQLNAAFEKVFNDYYEKYQQWPLLNDEKAIDTFLSSRPQFKNALMKLDFVLKDIAPTALTVLARLKKSTMGK